MLKTAVLVVAALALSGCGAHVAVTAPTVSPAATPAPSPAQDPACADSGLLALLGDIQEEYDRGAFDTERNVKIKPEHSGGWIVALSAAKNEAGFQLHKSLVPLEEAIGENFIGSDDPLIQESQETVVQITASTVLLECGLQGRYTFDDG